MASAATISAKLILDQVDYNRGLDQANSKADTFASKMTSIGTKMMAVGGAMTAGMTVPIIAGFKQITDSASDLNESSNAIKVVFGEATSTLTEFGKVSGKMVGLSTSDFNQMGAATGAMLTNFGMDQKTAASETIKLTQRAADMASIFNTEVPDALAAVQSGLRGETEPLRRYGVSLDAAAIKAKIMAMGLDTSTSELEKNAKATAALALFYEQTSKFAGDFVNTSDQLANSNRILQAELTNASAALGVQLLPYILKAVEFISKLVEGFKNLTPEQQKWILILAGVVAVIGPAILIFGSLATAIGAIIPIVTAVIAVVGGPLLAILAVVIAAVALFAIAWANNWGGIRDKIMPIINWLIGNFKAFLDLLGKIGNFISTYIAPIIGSLVNVELAILKKAFDGLCELFRIFVLPYFDNLFKAIGIVQGAMKPFSDWLNSTFGPALSGIGGAIKGTVDWLNKFADTINRMPTLPGWITPGSPTPFEIALYGIGEAITDLTAKFQGWGSRAFFSTFEDNSNIIGGFMTDIATALGVNVTEELEQQFYRLGTKIGDNVLLIADKTQGIVTIFNDMNTKFQGWGFEAFFSTFEDGTNMIGGATIDLGNLFGINFSDDFKNKIYSIAGAIGDVINKIHDLIVAVSNLRLPDWLGGEGQALKIDTGGSNGSRTGPGFASGGSFVVPSGFPNDTFPVNVTSGEKVTVDKNGGNSAPFDYDRMALSFRDVLLQVQR
jgi:hypothetical protein